MEQKEELLDLANQITTKFFPEQVVFFNDNGKEITEYYIENKGEINGENLGAEFGAGEGIIEVIPVISTVAGTIKALIELVKMFKKEKKKPDSEFIKEKWKLRLMENGVSNDKAGLIAEVFYHEMNALIR